jgi:predicted acyltransferase (DUF342 family)
MATNSWRQYGGTRKQNQFHNLTIGTLVADKVLLRESYAGKFIIPGSIYVGADVNTTGNTYTFQNNYTSYDNYVGKNLYLNQYLYFDASRQILDGDFTNAYMSGNFERKTIGVNIQNPQSAFDINGINSSQTDILSVASTGTQIRNTLGKNVNNRGISLNANNSNATLGFYIDTSLNYANSPDAQIRYSSGGNIFYVSANNNIISTNNTVLTASGSTFITSNTLMNISAVQSATISTKNTNILSRLYISNRGQPTNVYNESTIIYDISNGLYLYDAYENLSAKAGSAVTMVATDNSSNTFMRLITPNNAGLSITAGAYPNDQNRTLGAFGISDNTGKYRVNQTMVSGNSAVKYYSTTGFNTYAPRTDNYIMDINGPTHISNGEINKMAEVDFEVLRTSFSKLVKPFGISVGTSSTVFTKPDGNQVYPQYVSYTSDGGINWYLSRIDSLSNLEISPKTFTIGLYDDNYAIIATSNSYFYYTKNGGQTWWSFDFLDPNFTIVIRNAVSVYIGDFNGNIKRVFIIYTIRGSLQMNMVYFNINFTTLPEQNYNLISSFTTLSPNPSINTIYANDGLGDFVYFVGTGINKFRVSTASSQYLINTTYVYHNIACFSDNYVVAVGEGIISYTYDGTNWTNVITNTTLRSVYLYDANRGLAVGDNGVFLYTSDAAQTWTVVPNSILNASGYASRINGTNNKLRNVIMNDINTMSIVAVKQSFNIAGTAQNPIITNGLTKVYTCYIPNLYNRANNKILDVSGNMEISGDININDGGNIITNNSAFNLINNKALSVNFAGDATLINIGNALSGITNIKTNVDISGNVAMHKNLVLDRNISVVQDASINGNTSIGGNVLVGKQLDVTNKAIFREGIHVYGNIEHELDFNYLNRLYVEQDAYLYQRIFVGGDASFNGNVYIGGPVYITTTITNGTDTLTLNNPMITNNTISNNFVPIESAQGLEIGTSVSYYNPTYGWIIPIGTKIIGIAKVDALTGITVIDSNGTQVAPITGDIMNGSAVKLDRTLTGLWATQTVKVAYENSHIFSVCPDTSLNSRLYVSGDVSLNGRLAVYNDVSLNGNLVMYNSTSLMRLNPNGITYNYSTNPNFPTYNTLPLSQFQYIQTLTQSVQEILNTVTSKTGPIGITNDRDFNISRDGTFDATNINIDGESTNIDPSAFGMVDTNVSANLFASDNQNSGTRATTILTFDVGANNVLMAGNLIPSSPANINIGTDTLPLGSIYIYSQGALNFLSSNQAGDISKGTVSFNTTTGLFDISSNGSNSSTVVSYGGNVAIGKARPTTTLDVLGTSTFNGNITQQTGNLVLNNRLFVGSDLSMGGNTFLNKDVYIKGDSTFTSHIFALSDVSINSNLFILNDASFNTRIFVAGDTSLNSNLYVARNVNIIGDASLNNRLNIRGDVSLNSGLYVASKVVLNNDLSLNGNINVNGFAFFNNDEYLQGNLFVTGNQFLNGNMIINGRTNNVQDVIMNSRLFVVRDVSINSHISVQGVSNFNNDIYLNRNVYVSNDISLNGNLSIGGAKLVVNGETSLNGNLVVDRNLLARGDTSFNGNVFINAKTINNDEVTMRSRLFIANDLSLAANLLVNQQIVVRGDVSLNQNIRVAGQVISVGDISTNSRLFVMRDASFDRDVYINGQSFLNNDLSVNGNILSKNSIVNGNAFIGQSITVNSDASFNANLIVGGNTVINGQTNIVGALTTNSITNNGSMVIAGSTAMNGDVNIGSNLNVNQNTTLNGTLTVGNNATVNGRLNVMRDLSINGRLMVANYMAGSIPIGAIAGGAGLALGSFANDVNIGRNFYVGGDTTVYGNLTVVQDFTLIGQLVVKQYSVNQTITTLSYELMIAQDLSLNGELLMTGDASINGRVFIAGDVSINSNLAVGGRTSFAQPITIGNTLTINGNVIQNARVTNNALSIFNGDASLNVRLFVLGTSNFIRDVSMNSRLYVQNDTSLNANLFVQGPTVLQSDVSMNSRLYVENDTSLNGNFFARGLTILNSDVSTNNRLFVQNDSSFNSKFFVRGLAILNSDVSINNRLFVQNDTNLFSRLTVQGQTTINNDASMNYRLYVQNDVSMSSNLFVSGNSTFNSDVSMNQRLYVLNDVSMTSNLYVNKATVQNGDVSMNSRLYVGRDASINGNLYVTGKSVYQSEISFNKVICGTDASFTGNIAIYGNLYLQTDLRFDSLYVKKNLSATGNVYITGQTAEMVDASLGGNLLVVKDSSLCGRLAVSRDASFNRNINVLLDSSLNGNLFVGIDSSLNRNLFVGGNVLVQGNSITSGDVSMTSTLDLNGAMIARNNMNVYGIINQYSMTATPQDTIVNNTSYVTSTSSRVNLGTSASQNVYVPGNIGIGTTNPSVPLYINKSSASTGQSAGYYYDNTVATLGAINTSTAYNYSIYALNSIATSDKLIATSSVYFSDERIKTNIENIDGQKAIEWVRALQPKKYNYIDAVGQGTEPTWGFIAQEVKNVLEHSVSLSKNYIPNIYELCRVENGRTLILTNKTTELLAVDSIIKAVSVDKSEIILTVQEIVNDKTFIIREPVDDKDMVDGKLFIYGQEIGDFNNLDKNTIFTISTAALKQVDQELQETKKTVEEQKNRIHVLENQMKLINARLQIF